MSRRVPKKGDGIGAKSARTVTSKLVKALAADLHIIADGLDMLAMEYKEDKDHSGTAALVDAALDRAKVFALAWPRAKRSVLLRAPNNVVYGSAVLPPPSIIVVLARNEQIARDEIKFLERDWRDRRIMILCAVEDAKRLAGLPRHTPWVKLHSGYPVQLVDECRRRFDGRSIPLGEAISLIDWSKVML